jgi:hypothetical protein
VLPRGEDVQHAFALTGGGDVLVRVFDAEGRALAGARVRHRSPGTNVMMFGRGSPTDGEGKVRFTGLEPGLHGFQIDDSKLRGGIVMGGDMAFELGDEEAAEDDAWVEVEVREDSESEVELHALPSAALAGTVREGGSPLAGARVSLSKAGGRPRGHMPFGGGEQARTDGHGEYRFSDLKEGRYTVSVDHPSRAMPAELEVELEVGENDFDIELPVSILEGRITGPDKKALPGVSVRAERVQGGPQAQFFAISVMNDSDSDIVTIGDGSGPVGATTDADGRYTLRGVASDVDLVVKASGEGVQEGSSETVSVGPDETRSGVDLELEPAGAVEVEALLADGSAAQMCLVEATYLGDSEVNPEMGFIQSRSTKLTGLRPGAWRLSVSRMGEEREGDAKEEEVEVVAGETAKATVYLE